jgi:two-component system, chemotaxis family, CheB/CheR fusion protein
VSDVQRSESAGGGTQEEENPGQGHKPGRRFPVVAIGASAGGLDALTALLHHLPAGTGMAFVVIQHLDPRHESILSKLLARETAMPVGQAENGATLSPNRVYVIPPNTSMTIAGATLTLAPRESAGTAIDAFLRSLAASQRSAAVAVILSGTGSDGALGVQAVAEEGGIVFAQDPASAKFDGMPRSAIETGCVDFILAPDGIAAELASIAREPRLIWRDPPDTAPQFPGSQNDLETLVALLRTATGIDFNLYRQATFYRRLLRRLALLKIGSLADYVGHAKENPDELNALAQDVLIRVTNFFRDTEAFEALSRRVFPALIRKASKDGAIRIWVPGCSTGEEAYSIAICFLEVADQMRSRVSCKVFATDINDAAIEKARRGTYVENIVADVAPERLDRFFVRAGRDFQVSKKLRDQCIFSRHDLLNDPPFSRMDLISCRNVLIYLDSMQEHALSRFHFALKPGGYLLLGKAEKANGLFASVDRTVRLYVRQESARQAVTVDGTPAKRPVHSASKQELQRGVRPMRQIDLFQLADRVLTERYAPPRVIVNGNLEPVAYSGEAAAFASASPSHNQNYKIMVAAKIAQPEGFRNAIRKAARTGRSVRIEQVTLGEGASPGEVSVEVTPLGPDRQNFLMVFEERGAPPERNIEIGGVPTPEAFRKLEMRIRRLEKELASSRAHLATVIAEHEAVNEEAVAANEELQSLNEELESSKEEIEASYEELTTVNQELQVRNTEVENAREFAQATTDTVRGALLVLGPGLRVLKANRSFYRTFRLSPEEVEHRFIYELGDRVFGDPRLRGLLEDILPRNRMMEDFEIQNDNPSGGQGVILLNARRFEGEERILLAIEDVTESRRVETGLRQSQKWKRSAIWRRAWRMISTIC